VFRGEEKNPVNLLIFCLICGLYTLYWLYQTVEDVNKALNREEFNPMDRPRLQPALLSPLDFLGLQIDPGPA